MTMREEFERSFMRMGCADFDRDSERPEHYASIGMERDWVRWQAAYSAGQRAEREALAIPSCCGGSTLHSWGDREDGCALRLLFTSMKEATAWLDRQRAAIQNKGE